MCATHTDSNTDQPDNIQILNNQVETSKFLQERKRMNQSTTIYCHSPWLVKVSGYPIIVQPSTWTTVNQLILFT